MAMGDRRRGGLVNAVLLTAGVALLLARSLLPIYWIAVTSLKREREIYALPPTFFAGHVDLGELRDRAVQDAVCGLRAQLAAGGSGVHRGVSGDRHAGRLRHHAYPVRRPCVVARAIVAAYLLPPALLFIPLFIVLQRLGLIDSLAGLVLSYLPLRCRRHLDADRIHAQHSDRARRGGTHRRRRAVADPVCVYSCQWPRPASPSWHCSPSLRPGMNSFTALIYVYSDAVRTLTSGLVGMMMATCSSGASSWPHR